MTRRTGLVAGGIAVLALLVAGVWAAVLARVLDSDDDPEPAGGERAYVAVDRLCESLDLTAVFAILPPTGDGLRENVVEAEVGTLRDCVHGLGQGGSVGSLWIKVDVYDDPRVAGRAYQGDLSDGTIAVNSDTVDDIDGPWQEGTLGLGPGAGDFTAGAELCVWDRNLTVCVAMRMTAAPELADAPTDQDLADALRPVVEDVLARSAG